MDREAQSPLIITSSDGDPRAVAALAKLAETYALPVVNHNPRVVTLPSSHPMHAGYDSGPLVPEADLIINAECDVPWYPHYDTLKSGCKFAHIGEDPVYQRYPMRSFPSDLSMVSRSADVLRGAVCSAGEAPAGDDVRDRGAPQAGRGAPQDARGQGGERSARRLRQDHAGTISATASAKRSAPTP